MDKFKSEDKLRSDNSNRCPNSQQKDLAMQKMPISKQHLMIGVGILVLLLLVIIISSTFKSPLHSDLRYQGSGNNSSRNIDLPDLDASSPCSDILSLAIKNPEDNGSSPAPHGGDSALDLRRPHHFTSTPMESVLDKTCAAACCETTKLTPMVLPSTSQQTASTSRVVKNVHNAVPFEIVGSTTETLQSAPSGYYTLQLSSASQPTTLGAYAQQHQLTHYWVYKTYRDGKPWYVLVNGVYPSLLRAKEAVAQLPIDVQAKKPWVRQISQVKKDQK